MQRAERSRAVLPSLANVYTVLLHHKEWKGVLAIDEFAGMMVKRKLPPFAHGAELGEWSDVDHGKLALWLAQEIGIEPKDAVIEKAVMNVAQVNHFHPVRDWLRSLTWDGVERLQHWLAAHLGATHAADVPEGMTWDGRPVSCWDDLPADQTYLGKAGSKWLIGAVARVMRPGCKMDNVLILEGTQGIGKSSVFGALAGQWFTDQTIRLGDKDTYEVIRGQWVVELSELDALSKADSSAAKAFFSRSADRYRAFYGRRAATVPRQQVYGGTVNHQQYLRDGSGNRRYWPVRCASTPVNLEELQAEREQLFAEAVHRFDAGEKWWIEPDDRVLFEAEQEARFIGDAWESRIRWWLEEVTPDGPRDVVSTNEILGGALGLDAARWTHPEQVRVGMIMERIGWGRRRLVRHGVRAWFYVRPGTEVREGDGKDA